MQKNFSGIKMGNGKKNFLVQKWEMRVVHGCAVVKKIYRVKIGGNCAVQISKPQKRQLDILTCAFLP